MYGSRRSTVIGWFRLGFNANLKGTVVRVCLATSKNLLLVLYAATGTGEKTTTNAFFPRSRDAKTLFSILHHLSPVILANATIVAFVLLRYSRFSFHSYTQREQAPTQKSAGKWQLRPLENSCTKDYKRHSLVQTSFTAWPTKLCV